MRWSTAYNNRRRRERYLWRTDINNSYNRWLAAIMQVRKGMQAVQVLRPFTLDSSVDSSHE